MASGKDGFRPVALIVACALFMENLDGSIIVTALPQISHAFKTDVISLSIAITSYLLSVAVFIPASGWVADRFGARTIFCTAIILFALASICCGLSGDLLMFTLSRAVQGLGGAMMVPVGRLVLMRSTEKQDLVKAMAYLTVPAVLGPVLGPPLGGFIVTYVSWRWIFFLNVPIAILGVILVLRLIPNSKEEKNPAFDWVGFVLSGVALASLVFSLEVASQKGFSLTLLVLLVIGAATAILYLRHARRAANPILDLRLLGIPTFRSAFLAGNLFRVSAGAAPFLLPIMLQVGFGLTAFSSGLFVLSTASGSLLMRFLAGGFLRKMGFRIALTLNGLVCAGLTAAHGLLTPLTPAIVLVTLLFCTGFLRGLQYNGIAALNFADIEKPQMSRATAMASTAQQLSQSIGVAFGAMVLNLTLFFRGRESLAPDDFHLAFVAVGIVGAISAVLFLGLHHNAGSDVSGHRRP
ncbi:MAG TPA: DHA2 family efflux MFS transporter permease subunit [Devosiaceae bacterium]|jgi:EmrB/QacA subfamily drug resistance transporter